MRGEKRAVAPSSGGGFFTNLKVGTKIYAGFGAVCLAVAILGGIGVWTVVTMGSQFHKYAEMASDTVLVGTLESEMYALRLRVNQYLAKDTKENLAAVREEFKTIRHGIDEAKKEILKPERAKLVAEIDRLEDEYLKGFDQIVALMEKRNKLVYDSLNPLGAETRKLLTAISEGAYNAKDYQSSNYALSVQENFLLARLYAAKFLDTNDEDEVGRVNKEFEDVYKSLKTLDESLENPERRKLLATAAANLPKYKQTFDQLVETIHERNKIRDEVLGKDGELIVKHAGAIKASAEADEKALENEVSAEVKANVIESSAIAIVTLAAAGFLAWIISRGITGPVTAMTQAMLRLANKEWTTEVPAQGRRDEIGEMAKSVQVFKENGQQVEKMQAEQEQMKKQAETDKTAAMNKLADDFTASVGGVVSAVASAATEMQQSAQTLSATAEETNRQSSAVAAASEQASSNVQTVASSAEELSASINEISRQVTQSTAVANKAVEEVKKANANVQGLAEAAQKIGEVVNLINDIASQTNLLALNATIEAARAGEAGKGFAVVASEVKSLANQTAKATEQIAAQISGVQSATSEAVAAIQAIGATIGEISTISTAVSAAVEEQSAATKEIAKSVQQASTGTNEVSSNISGVTKAAGETGQASGQVLQAAGELSQQAEKLRLEVDNFVAKVRSA